MTSLFRRIRLKLATDNQILKYSRYAIGEIVLVVVGILIALSINNWNTNRLNKLKEDNYLINLRRDLKNQLKIIDRNLEGELLIFNNLNKANINYENIKKFKDLREYLIPLVSINDRYTFTITSPTYTELLSTGNIDLITNIALKDQMVMYYEDLELTAQVIQKNNDYKDNVISSKTISIIEIIGGSNPDRIYGGMESTFDDYQTSTDLLEIIKNNISEPENELALLNIIRFRRLIAFNHMNRLENAKTQTKALLSTLDGHMK